MHAPGTHFVRFAALGALVAAPAIPVVAQRDSEVAACVYRSNIDHTRILDDSNILFFMRDHSIYQNTLKDACYGLKITKRFGYGEASMHRLCTGNLIAVLEDVTPGGAGRNSVCKLGLFVPVDKEVVDDLIAASESSHKNKEGDRRSAIKVEPVELPPPEPPVSTPAPSPAATEPAPGEEPAPTAPAR